MKIHSVGVQLFHRQTDMTKLRVAFHNFANSPEKLIWFHRSALQLHDKDRHAVFFSDIVIWSPQTHSMGKILLNPSNAELNPICHLLALLAHHILHVSGMRVKWCLRSCGIIRSHAVLECLNLENAISRQSRNVGNDQSTLPNIPEELRANLHCGWSLKRRIFLKCSSRW